MLTKTFIFLLAALLLAFNPLHANEVIIDDISVLSDMEVFGEVNKNFRQYQIQNGKRFVTQPYGQAEAILFIADKIRQHGKASKVSTRRFKMPSNYVGRFIEQYEYSFPNGHQFSLFQAQDFTALGYYATDGHLVLDVLDGGGAFAAPQLWGPYDQLIGKDYRSHMELLIGDGERDNMGPMKASYSIGYTAVMPEEDYSRYGQLYNTAVSSTYDMLLGVNSSDLKNDMVSESRFENTTAYRL